jgi:hypothetical protein
MIISPTRVFKGIAYLPDFMGNEGSCRGVI